MYQVFNLTESPNVRVIASRGPFTLIEHLQDLSIDNQSAQQAYYASKMNIRKRQVICELAKSPCTIQAGAMQWMVGDVRATTGLKGVGDLIAKYARGKVTKESAIKPEYEGTGLLVLEPTTKHLLLIDLDEWGGSIVLEDGLFLACQSGIKQQVVARSTFSSAAAGNEGFFNLGLYGSGVVVLESYVPMEELIEISLENDELKIDGNFAVAWSSSLKFTVERAAATLTGSAVSKEGLVNVYRGTGRVLMAPVL